MNRPGGNAALRALADAARRLNRPRAYRARHGLTKGLRQIGGIGLLLPRRGAPSREELFLAGLDLTGATVYDAGAFRGLLTLFFARSVGATGRVVSFEPHPDNCARISVHLRLNGFDNVTVRNVAVGESRGTLTLTGPAGGDGRTTGSPGLQERYRRTGDAQETIEVEVVSLDDEVESGRVPEPSFIKIDVEGMEAAVLRGLRSTLENLRPRLFVEMHGADRAAKLANAREVVDLVLAQGYSLHHVEHDAPVDERTADLAAEGHLFCVPFERSSST